jgi:hypothetical protein
VSCPKEAELRSPLPGNGANLLTLQETLRGCRPEVLGNLRNQCFWCFLSKWINGMTKPEYNIQTFNM